MRIEAKIVILLGAALICAPTVATAQQAAIRAGTLIDGRGGSRNVAGGDRCRHRQVVCNSRDAAECRECAVTAASRSESTSK